MSERVKHQVLVVEDEPELALLLHDYLCRSGYECAMIGDGKMALARILAVPPDLVLLDIMLPGLDGMEVCRAVRKTSDVPIIMVTARHEEIDRIIGLDIGADDYVCKPFSPREVVARVGAVLRRPRGVVSAAVTDRLVLDDGAFVARIDGKRLDLTPREFALLAVLARKPGRIFSRAQLLDLVHGDCVDAFDRVIDSHIKNLRRKIAEKLPGEDVIHAVYGVGYRFEWGE